MVQHMKVVTLLKEMDGIITLEVLEHAAKAKILLIVFM